MQTYDRDFIYESDDFNRICRFIIEDNSKKKQYFIWHIDRIVDWKYNLVNTKKYFPVNFSNYAHLWFNYFHELIGFIISENFDNSFFIFVKDSYMHLYSELIGWYRSKWANCYDSLITQAVENQKRYIFVLEKEGFIKKEQMEITRIFDTSSFKDYIIPDKNFSFQSMEENKNYIEQANLRLNAWPHADVSKELDLQIREYCRKSPIYNAKFDFVLVNKEGKHIAGCEAFIDFENNTSEIERICTHSDHYNKGYSQMILKACMNKLYQNNIQIAYITGWDDKTIHLYGKLGHINEVCKYFYELKTKD